MMMSIAFDQGVFTLTTKNTMYQFMTDRYHVLIHLWYGKNTHCDMSYLVDYPDVAFSPSVFDAGRDRTYSLDTRLQEYPVQGTGDLRIVGGKVKTPDGCSSLDLRFEGFSAEKGRAPIEGLPYARAEAECETLIIHLRDSVLDLNAKLYYVVFEELDIIARHIRFENSSDQTLILEQAASAVLDLPNEDMDLISFSGRHAQERQLIRRSLEQGTVSLDSKRGTSSHQQNPAFILAGKDTTETCGSCYGMMLAYSGSFQALVEKDPLGQIRAVMGIHPDLFEWVLEPGQSFETPEVFLSFSSRGFEQLSHNYHGLINTCIVPARFQNTPRDVVINNWEATYFDFDGDKIAAIAGEAAALGIDMLVLDDGWFGSRNNDSQALGDWFVNEEKLGGSLQQLIERIHAKGMKFGLWIEPEMISEESRLYQEHPEWALSIPARGCIRCRYQLNLDLSNPDVQEYLFERMDALLSENEIDYIKWDMNRPIAQWYSPCWPADRQKEVPHRYMLGLYALLNRITQAHPGVLFEGCSGGGGRFDAGMLFYHPQIWTSDNTDAHDRTRIQYGTSFFYPVSAMSAHVSAVPNHQTGRVTSLSTRGAVAMAGSFGYELDLSKLSGEEKREIREQVGWYKQLRPLIFQGDYYRLTGADENRSFWMFVSKDKRKAFVEGVVYEHKPTALRHRIRLKGLDPDAWYRCIGASFESPAVHQILSGEALMSGGCLLDYSWGYDKAMALVFEKVE